MSDNKYFAAYIDKETIKKFKETCLRLEIMLREGFERALRNFIKQYKQKGVKMDPKLDESKQITVWVDAKDKQKLNFAIEQKEKYSDPYIMLERKHNGKKQYALFMGA